MRHFALKAATAACFAVVVAFASAVPGQPLRAAASQEGADAAAPTIDHSMPDHDHGLADAASTMSGHDHMNMSPADRRELVHFPPEMRMHMLRNMRDHVETLNGILRDLATADYSGAAALATERLGLDSPSAASCKPRPEGATAPPPNSMDEMMALYMPKSMQAIGLGMHTSASEFAAVAQRAATTHDPLPAMKALSRVTDHCVACHSAYRLQ
jgi:hypothetical protein